MSSALVDDAAFDSQHFAVRPDAVVRHYGNEAVASVPGDGRPVFLDAAGSVLVQVFDGDTTVAELVEDLNNILGIPPGVARERIRGVVTMLERAHVLAGAEAADPGSPADVFPAPPNP